MDPDSHRSLPPTLPVVKRIVRFNMQRPRPGHKRIADYFLEPEKPSATSANKKLPYCPPLTAPAHPPGSNAIRAGPATPVDPFEDLPEEVRVRIARNRAIALQRKRAWLRRLQEAPYAFRSDVSGQTESPTDPANPASRCSEANDVASGGTVPEEDLIPITDDN